MSGESEPRTRILILTASVGSGHVRAAQAVERAILDERPGAMVSTVDVLTLASPPFRTLYSKLYIDLVVKAPHLVGLFYDWTDRAPALNTKTDKLRVLVQRMNLGELSELLVRPREDSAPRPRASRVAKTMGAAARATVGRRKIVGDVPQWDAIVCTHFLPPELVTRLVRKKKLDMPMFTVVTDFDAHGLWVSEPTEHYFAGAPAGALALGRWGVQRERITVTGIPIDPVFSQSVEKALARTKHGIPAGKPVLLMLGGGAGLGPVEEMLQATLKLAQPLHAIVVCGNNKSLKARLDKISVPQQHSVSILGFTKEMDTLLAAADVVISKPGGLTTSEVMARGVPMIIVNPIPGQESRNSDYLLENGAALKASSPEVLAMKLQSLLEDDGKLKRLRENAKAMGKPNAAKDVARAVLSKIDAKAR